MKDRMNKCAERIVNNLKRKGFEVESFEIDGDQINMTSKRFGIKINMTFNAKELGLI